MCDCPVNRVSGKAIWVWTESWYSRECKPACWGSHNAMCHSRFGPEGSNWMMLTLEQRCAQEGQIFWSAFLMYAHFWPRDWIIISPEELILYSLSQLGFFQKKQPPLEFKSKEIVQNRFPRQSYTHQSNIIYFFFNVFKTEYKFCLLMSGVKNLT